MWLSKHLLQVRATSKPSASDSGPVEDSEDSKQQDIADSAGPADELTDEQLLEVFRQTSSFNVKGALAGNALEEELERCCSLFLYASLCNIMYTASAKIRVTPFLYA